MKKQKGITLVALIITIIVMLILVAVSVAVVINSGLLTKAKTTGDTYKANAAEEANLAENQVKIENRYWNSFQEYVDFRAE